ncbi:protein NUCLEAR FUSION DEFECTIVE 4-like [Selaginella moellendorffii]|uniref:protein NUCLEAR FUSION DEFECTIVE 4-like n=1 Tax=Selaginella moellendorffii TaxID=88036 RepID=UPI000D1C8A3A|nr:protein NUCLEAR FUSION DEFECTIVE 4-like [Selaginella moellendorffii]|eukprot:XP_024529129.1 protein NUCLEAR FUSION DEFECTIVE 4-like [Selaginella moellendorffii]
MEYGLRDLRNSRWIALAASCWIMALNSSIYTFSGYSQAMKIAMALDQKTLTAIVTFSGVGSALGIIPGLLYALVPPWLLLAAGAAGQSVALLMIWLTITHRIHGAAVWQLCLYELLIGISQASVQTPVVLASARNFGRDTGAVLGLVKGYHVLGGSIFLQAFYAIGGGGGSGDGLPLMLSWMIPLMLPLALAARPLSRTAGSPPMPYGGMYGMSGSLVALAAWLLVVSVLEVFMRFTRATQVMVCLIIVLLLLLLAVIALVAGFQDKDWNATLLDREEQLISRRGVLDREVAGSAREALLDHDEKEPTGRTEALLKTGATKDHETGRTSPPPRLGDDHTLAQVATCVDFWLLFVALVFGFGAANAVSTNLTQLAISLGYSQKIGPVFVSLFCVSSCFARIAAGLAADYCLKRFGTPKSTFLALGMASNSIGTALAAVPVPGAAIFVAVLGAASDGVNWGLTAAIACEMFGERRLGVVFNALFVGNPVGHYLLSSRVVGYFYDREAGRELVCHGGHCFRKGFAALSAASAIGACLFRGTPLPALRVCCAARDLVRGKEIHRSIASSGVRTRDRDAKFKCMGSVAVWMSPSKSFNTSLEHHDRTNIATMRSDFSSVPSPDRIPRRDAHLGHLIEELFGGSKIPRVDEQIALRDPGIFPVWTYPRKCRDNG